MMCMAPTVLTKLSHRIDNLQGHLTDLSLSGGIIGTLSLVMSSQGVVNDDVCFAVV